MTARESCESIRANHATKVAEKVTYLIQKSFSPETETVSFKPGAN